MIIYILGCSRGRNQANGTYDNMDVFLKLLSFYSFIFTFIDSSWITHHAFWFHLSPCTLIAALCSSNLLRKRKPDLKEKPKTKANQTKNKNKNEDSCHGSGSVAQWPLRHTVYPLIYSSCECASPESFVWLEASGFCYPIDTWLPLGSLLDISLYTCIMELLMFWICRFVPFTCSNRS